jgi:8-oxo-dGTP pyrophosphatase MutT (NUDIX family)
MRVEADMPGHRAGDRWPDPLHRLGYRIAHRCLLAWWWLRRPSARGAGVALWRDDGRLLVVRTSYRGALLSLPSGGLAAGEEPRTAAARELREELGIELAPAELREAWRIAFVFEHRRIEETVFEPLRPTNQQPRPDRREIVWAGWLSPAEISALPTVPSLDGYLARIGHDREGEGEPTPDTLVQR